MIPFVLAMLLPAPAGAVGAAALSEQTSGPRPNRDPDAVPDGKRVSADRPTLAFNFAAVSDYRVRGISQTNGHPAVQASVEASAPAGFYAGLWGSSVAAYEGAHSEVDGYGGYRTALHGWDVETGIISYFYPGADGVSSAEVYASGAHAVGNAEVKAGISYTPHQAELGAGDGLYIFTEAAKPLPSLPITLRTHFGRETGVNTISGSPKIDWLLGADIAVSSVTWSLAWVDARYRGRSSEHDGKGRLVAALAFEF